MPVSPFPFHLMAKPVGNRCNLACEYCFYLEKGALYDKAPSRMTDALFERYIVEYFETHPPTEPVTFTWQGGEPTLAGLDFYRTAVALQQRHGMSRPFENSFQTNGLLLDDAWAAFFAENDLLVGLSLDGPPRTARCLPPERGRRGEPYCRASRIAVAAAAWRPLQHSFLRLGRKPRKGAGGVPVPEERGGGIHAVHPGRRTRPRQRRDRNGAAAGHARRARRDDALERRGLEYGIFLTDMFAEWVKEDVGAVFVMNFEWALANHQGKPGAACHHQPICGRCLVLEHDGSVYSCDHFVYPDRRLGTLCAQPLDAMLDAPTQWSFGEAKGKILSARCRECGCVKGCWGGCPKHRFHHEDGEKQNYLCPGYRHFFTYISPYMKAFAHLETNNRPMADIMGLTIMTKR